MQVAFATYEAEPNLTEDDKVLAQYLIKQNITICPAVWDDAKINWQQYDAVVLRSMWDYFEKQEAFTAWLNKLELLGCKVLNSVSVVRENQSKKYFDSFSNNGILLPPYQYCLQKHSYSLAQTIKDNNWGKAVIKPAVSSGSFNTWVTTSASSASDELRFAEMLENGDVIVQKFMEEIITGGELSLIFFNKQFSHAILKRAKEGDFRIQIKFGGTAEPFLPANEILQQAIAIINTIKEPLLYARVDGLVVNKDQFYLMELELIEPRLSVSSNEKACENFYNALLQLLPVHKQN